MFCCQCEETVKQDACTIKGVCGKDETTSVLQDHLIESAKWISLYMNEARSLGVKDKKIDRFILDALFTTVTNVNFDSRDILARIENAVTLRLFAQTLYLDACRKNHIEPKTFTQTSIQPKPTLSGSLEQEPIPTWKQRAEIVGEDIASLQEILLHGLKGTASYAHHAYVLGKELDEVYAGFHAGLAALCMENPTLEDMLGHCMKCGELNLKVMELLDSANTGAYGHPVPTPVRVTPVKGKAILVSGHDLKDLEELLKQTEGWGINIYTHGEMLPAHGYPKLKAYKHLVGNYGGAWQDQAKEFDEFPGAILMTTNCIQRPKETYKNRIFTSGLVGWPGLVHCVNYDFTPVIEAAIKAEGFTEDVPEKTILVGFGHNAVLGVADKVIDAVKSGALRHFFLVGGCDGHKSTRSYYTEFAQQVPQDCVILTLACGKFRFNQFEFGDIGGIPRLLDMGQCNDAFSAIRVAVELAKAFNCGVNDLPLSLVLSWYEQKAVAILLTLLYLGIKDVRIGPDLPAFISPGVLKFLQENFNLMPITTAEEDLKDILGVEEAAA